MIQSSSPRVVNVSSRANLFLIWCRFLGFMRAFSRFGFNLVFLARPSLLYARGVIAWGLRSPQTLRNTAFAPNRVPFSVEHICCVRGVWLPSRVDELALAVTCM